ncbi:hypothetical protein K431DRAFT_296080 [Polychaeton citri CBS 116435]|uniref:Box C/D snoRNA protein 1 n=1 Tax=Polychaeton citri CBS 116435 TaxID=1314669 RepID=A0A9P4UM90_9PEZI|nr:hypothetical protein K431DRAFT_296080 [Polychaeton citri CBS 116435]
MADQSLSELCTICYTNAPKYRCPRCQTRTCSLPCYKRHQQRASCNGQRNPAAYVKKSQWQTPSGIDHDYNYLKSVERNLARAAEDTGDRKAATKESNNNSEGKHDRNVARAWREGSALQRYLHQNQIEVIKAPKGMSRQAANMTRVTNGQRILWTIEWMDETGKVVGKDDEAAAEGTISELWDAFITRTKNAERKRLLAENHAGSDNCGQRTKRKRLSADRTASQPAPRSHETTSQHTSNPEELAPGQLKPQQAETAEETDQTSATKLPTSDTPTLPPAEPTPSNPAKHFYLLKPRTSSKIPVLIPLTQTSKLTLSITGRTLLEFPTIYALEYPSSYLPSDFLLEQDYVKARKAEDQELDTMIKVTRNHGGVGRANGSWNETGKSEGGSQQQPLDQGAILEMLRRDVGV